jgi:aspartate/methionine/tyrosine aminotransferase
MYRERTGDAIYLRAIQKLQQEIYQLGQLPTKNIFATSGVSGATISIFLTVAELLGSKNSTIRIGLMDPFYVYHRDQAISVFGKERLEFTYIPVNADFSFNMDAIRSAAKKVDLIIWTNPGNPSAHTLTTPEIQQLTQIAREHPRCWFVSDEVYADMIISGIHKSFSWPFEKNVMVCRGFSKSLAVGAWRLGYVLGHEETLTKLATAHDRVFICANWTQMAVGSFIMNQGEEYKRHTDHIRGILKHNETVLADAFEQVSIFVFCFFVYFVSFKEESGMEN